MGAAHLFLTGGSILLGSIPAWGQIVMQQGIADDFAAPSEPASPSVFLAPLIAPHQDLDLLAGCGGSANTAVGHTFAELPSVIEGARLDFRVQGGCWPFGVDTDGVFLAFADGTTVAFQDAIAFGRPFGPYVGSGLYPEPDPVGLLGFWDVGEVADVSLDLSALPLASGGTLDLVPMLNTHGFLDVVVSDETGVDYLRLTLTLGAAGGPGGIVTERLIDEPAMASVGKLLQQNESFGTSVTWLGDVPGMPGHQIAIGAANYDAFTGAVYLVSLDDAGTPIAATRISEAIPWPGFADPLDLGDEFGSSLDVLPDLDRNGAPDIAVGAHHDDDTCTASDCSFGAVWILSPDPAGGIAHCGKISKASPFLSDELTDGEFLGLGVSYLGDLDGDGSHELAIGASRFQSKGRVWIVSVEWSEAQGYAVKGAVTYQPASLAVGDDFGAEVEALGDLDEDGDLELAVGAPHSDVDLPDAGAVWILSLHAELGLPIAVSELALISSSSLPDGAVPAASGFGSGLAALKDLDGDGTLDLAVGAPSLDASAGKAFALFLRPDGTVKCHQEIAPLGLPGLDPVDEYGLELDAADFDGDGSLDLAVCAPLDDGSCSVTSCDYGAVWLESIHGPVPSVVVSRPGDPPNPEALLPGTAPGPAVGMTWEPRIDHGSFAADALLDFLGISAQASNLPSPFGTILCGLDPAVVVVSPLVGLPFPLPVPAVCSHVGLGLCVQGGSVLPSGGVALTNALDVVLGSY